MDDEDEIEIGKSAEGPGIWKEGSSEEGGEEMLDRLIQKSEALLRTSREILELTVESRLHLERFNELQDREAGEGLRREMERMTALEQRLDSLERGGKGGRGERDMWGKEGVADGTQGKTRESCGRVDMVRIPRVRRGETLSVRLDDDTTQSPTLPRSPKSIFSDSTASSTPSISRISRTSSLSNPASIRRVGSHRRSRIDLSIPLPLPTLATPLGLSSPTKRPSPPHSVSTRTRTPSPTNVRSYPTPPSNISSRPPVSSPSLLQRAHERSTSTASISPTILRTSFLGRERQQDINRARPPSPTPVLSRPHSKNPSISSLSLSPDLNRMDEAKVHAAGDMRSRRRESGVSDMLRAVSAGAGVPGKMEAESAAQGKWWWS